MQSGLVDRASNPKSGSRRRFWSSVEKRRMVAESLPPGASVSKVAQRYGVNANLLFTWRRRETRSAASGGLEPLKLLPVTVADEGMAAAPIAPSAPAGRMGLRWSAASGLLLGRMWAQPRSRAWSRHRPGDDPDPGGRSGVAGDGPHRHAQGLRPARAVRPEDAEARSALCPFVCLPRSRGRSDQMPLELRACACSPNGSNGDVSCGHRRPTER
jgi:transposase